MKYSAAIYSAIGVRSQNEDSFLLGTVINERAAPFTKLSVTKDFSTPAIFAIADGMGGMGRGDLASYTVVKKLLDECNKASTFNESNLTQLITQLHSDIIAIDKSMGSTLCALVLQEKNSAILNLGDSRAYRMRHGLLLQMTNDDSLQSYDKSAKKNIITNGLGGGLVNISVNIRFSDKIAIAGDRFMICSDGVHGVLSDTFIESTLIQNISCEEAAATLVKRALSLGSSDNCSALVVDIL